MQHDLLALSLACVVSLLFAKNVSEFLNTCGKKQGQYHLSASIDSSRSVNGEHAFSSVHQAKSPVENLIYTCSPYAVATASYKGQRLFILEGIPVISPQPDRDKLGLHGYNAWAADAGSSISITQRKLII